MSDDASLGGPAGEERPMASGVASVARARGGRARRGVHGTVPAGLPADRRVPGRAPPTACSDVRFTWLKGYDDPATPDALDRVGVLKVGPEWARNVLVLNPGTSGAASYFLPLAQDIVRETRGRWQVWSVERRENQLEDHSVLNLAKQGRASNQAMFDYYLGWLTDPTVTDHFQLIPDSDVAYRAGGVSTWRSRTCTGS